MVLNSKEITVSINRDSEAIKLIFEDMNKLEVNLSNNSVDDIKNLFDEIFDIIIEEKTGLISFKLIDSKNDLFNEVAKDIIDQLNSEILQSETNIEQIRNLVRESSNTDSSKNDTYKDIN